MCFSMQSLNSTNLTFGRWGKFSSLPRKSSSYSCVNVLSEYHILVSLLSVVNHCENPWILIMCNVFSRIGSFKSLFELQPVWYPRLMQQYLTNFLHHLLALPNVTCRNERVTCSWFLLFFNFEGPTQAASWLNLSLTKITAVKVIVPPMRLAYVWLWSCCLALH